MNREFTVDNEANNISKRYNKKITPKFIPIHNGDGDTPSSIGQIYPTKWGNKDFHKIPKMVYNKITPVKAVDIYDWAEDWEVYSHLDIRKE